MSLRFGLLQESETSANPLVHLVSHGSASSTTINPVSGSVLPGSTVTFSWSYTGGAGSGPDVAYKYTSKELDDSTDLYFYEARYYDAVLGRFISADTIVPDPNDPQALNRYAYALNNPLRYTDPTGNISTGCDFCGSGGGFDQNNRFDFGLPDFNAQTSSFNFSTVNNSSSSFSANSNFSQSQSRSDLGTRRIFGDNFGGGNVPFLKSNFDFFDLGHGNNQQFINLPPTASEQALGSTACCDATDIVGFSVSGTIKGVKLGVGLLGIGGKELAQRSLLEVTRAITRKNAGFADTGTPVILDSNLEKRGLADALRVAGFNVRSVSEIFGKDPGNDIPINKLAKIIGARVLTRDRGRQPGQGFGSNAIPVDPRAKSIDSIIRILGLGGGR